MRLYIALFLFVFSLHSIAEEIYLLEAGDTISIEVYGEDDMRITVKVDGTGLIHYPFIGAINVMHKSVHEVTEMVIVGLKAGYFVDPDVHVSIVEYRPFYIHGQVERPGAFPYSPNITVSMGIALAGGLTERASSTNWLLQKPNTTDQIKVTGDEFLFPGDILIIKQSFF